MFYAVNTLLFTSGLIILVNKDPIKLGAYLILYMCLVGYNYFYGKHEADGI